MARLPQYQEVGLVSADIPRVDFATSRDAMRATESLGNALDKISQFAFGKVKEQQELENKVIGIQMRTELEGEVQKELNKLMVEVETGQLMDYNRINDRVKSLTGYATSLANISPEQAQGLMTSINSGGRALLAKSSDLLIKAYGAEQDYKTDELISNTSKFMQTNVYGLVDQLDPEAIKTMETQSRAAVFANAAMNPTTLPKKMEEYEKARINARDSAMINHFVSGDFATSPSDRLNKLRSGDAGKFQPLWDSMDQTQKDNLTAKMLKRYVEDVQLVDQQDKLTKLNNQATNANDYDLYYTGKIGGDELKKRLIGRGYVFTREELKAIAEGDVPGAGPQLYGTLESEARRGLLTEARTESLAKNNQISWKQRNELNKVINKTDTADMAEAKSYISNSFVPNPLDPTTRQSHQRKADVINQLIIEKANADYENKPFNLLTRAYELVQGRMSQEDMKQLSAARERLQRQLSEAGLNSEREDWTDQDLKNAGVSNADKRKAILRSVRAIQDKK